MARATRSSNRSDEKPKENPHPAPAPSKGAKGGAKKRKRVSDVHPDEQPATKLAKNDTSIKEEDAQDTLPVVQQGAGDVPLDAHNAQRILAILEKSVYSFCRSL